MNYEMKGTSGGSIFSFVKDDPSNGSQTYNFTNFDVSFSLETVNGYKFTTKTPSTGDYTIFQLSDSHSFYKLNGRFKGKLTYEILESGDETQSGTTKYDGLIGGWSNSNDSTKQDICEMFAAGVIHLTYNF